MHNVWIPGKNQSSDMFGTWILQTGKVKDNVWSDTSAGLPCSNGVTAICHSEENISFWM